MKEKPRKQGESLFAHGGGVCTLFYGFLIALISLTAFLIVPAKLLASSGRQLTPAAVADVLQSPKLLACCQTYAFTVLGLSQLFHAIGMRDVENLYFGWIMEGTL